MSSKDDMQPTQAFDEIDKAALLGFTCIIGFDLGHGEFSLFQASDEQNDSARCIEINNQRSQITAIAIRPDGGILIGNRAITTYDDAAITVGFKRRPGENPDFERLIGLFFAEVLKSALAEGKINPNSSTLILVGCPTEWDKERQMRYQTILHEAIRDLPYNEKLAVAVIPESRAAIQCARRSGQFSIDELQARAVSLLDFGSSTVDATLLQSGQDIHDVDDGCDLGAFLLDELIACEALREQDEKTRARICDAMRYRISNLGRCLLRAREVKEAYFNMPEFKENRLLTRGVIDIESRDGNIDYLDIRLTMNRIRELIEETPLSCIEESVRSWNLPEELLFFPPPEYANLSYRTAMTKFLENVRRKTEQRDRNISKVLLAGGAARMDLIKTIVTSAFPNTVHATMSAPDTSTAEGLVLRGRAEIMCARLIHDMHTRFTAEITSTIQADIDKFYYLIADSVVDAVVCKVIDAEIQRACNNRMQGSDLAASCAKEVSCWIDDGNLKPCVRAATENWFTAEPIDKVNDLLGALASKYSIPAVTIRRETALSMAQSINTSFIEYHLKQGLNGPNVICAVEESKNIFNWLCGLVGIWDLGDFSLAQRDRLRDEIRSRLHKGLMEALQGQIGLVGRLQTSLLTDVERDIEKVVALETCAYL